MTNGNEGATGGAISSWRVVYLLKRLGNVLRLTSPTDTQPSSVAADQGQLARLSVSTTDGPSSAAEAQPARPIGTA